MPDRHPRPSRRPPRALGLALVALAGVAALAGCGTSDEPTSPSTRSGNTAGTIARSSGGTIVLPRRTTPATVGLDGTTIPTSSPSIVRFEVANPVACTSPDAATATATYELEGADRVVFLVDGQQVEGNPPAPSGTFDLPLPCDGGVHIVLLTAVSPSDRTTLDNRTVFAPRAP